LRGNGIAVTAEERELLLIPWWLGHPLPAHYTDP